MPVEKYSALMPRTKPEITRPAPGGAEAPAPRPPPPGRPPRGRQGPGAGDPRPPRSGVLFRPGPAAGAPGGARVVGAPAEGRGGDDPAEPAAQQRVVEVRVP